MTAKKFLLSLGAAIASSSVARGLSSFDPDDVFGVMGLERRHAGWPQSRHSSSHVVSSLSGIGRYVDPPGGLWMTYPLSPIPYPPACPFSSQRVQRRIASFASKLIFRYLRHRRAFPAPARAAVWVLLPAEGTPLFQFTPIHTFWS